MIILAYYTKGTPYEYEIRTLEESLYRYHLTHIIRAYEPRGKWEYNTGIKPEFIWEVMTEYQLDRAVYIDADAEIIAPPLLFDTFDAEIGIGYKCTHMLSGTIFFTFTPRVKALVRRWVTMQLENPLEWDQKTLAKAIAADPDLNVMRIPPSYVKVFDAIDMGTETIIQQNQASRRFKEAVNASA